MKERHATLRLEEKDWDKFLIQYAGDVDRVVAEKSGAVEKYAASWKGTSPTAANDDGSFLAKDADLTKTPLAVLEAEIGRLEKTVATDNETAKRLAAVSKRINGETVALNRLKEKLADFQGARDRVASLAVEREQGYVRVFEALLGEEQVLNELYAPLMERIKKAGGTLAKLSFSVARVVDVESWAKRGEEDLLDRRGGPFKGVGFLTKVATQMLHEPWRTGDSATVSAAMTAFRDKYQEELLTKAPYPRSDSNYRPWARRFVRWLYSTDHISIEYGIKYDGIDIQKLSPGPEASF